MKTIIRYEDNTMQKVVVKTLEDNVDTGILHTMYFPDDMKINGCEVGFGWTESGEGIENLPVIAILGKENTESMIFEAVCLCTKRMASVVSALQYWKDHEIQEFEETQIYGSIIKLIQDYMKSQPDQKIFIDLTNLENVNKHADYAYKILFKDDGEHCQTLILPRDDEQLDKEALYIGRNMVEVEGKFKWSYSVSPTGRIEDAPFIMYLEFNKSVITMADAIWAFSLIVEKGLKEIPNIREEDEERRLYSSMNFTILHNVAADLIPNSTGDTDNAKH